jgi:hypothetical protein
VAGDARDPQTRFAGTDRRVEELEKANPIPMFRAVTAFDMDADRSLMEAGVTTALFWEYWEYDPFFFSPVLDETDTVLIQVDLLQPGLISRLCSADLDDDETPDPNEPINKVITAYAFFKDSSGPFGADSTPFGTRTSNPGIGFFGELGVYQSVDSFWPYDPENVTNDATLEMRQPVARLGFNFTQEGADDHHLTQSRLEIAYLGRMTLPHPTPLAAAPGQTFPPS